MLTILLEFCERTLSTISLGSFSMNTDWREEQFFSPTAYAEEEFVIKVQSQRPSPDVSLENYVCAYFYSLKRVSMPTHTFLVTDT